MNINHIVKNPAQRELLNWYDQEGRDLPWRYSGESGKANIYHVMLSEFMLQQTTVATVKPYFAEFTKRWPDIEALARADDDDVMRAWAGLGYYARARNLLKAARQVAELGDFPKTPEELQKLPGVGPYTAAAIASIGCDYPVVPLDGNIKRIFARLFRIEKPIDKPNKSLDAAARLWAGDHRPGDIAQALMDLGASMCRPRSPDCEACPMAAHCQAYAEACVAQYPKTSPKRAKKKWGGHAYVMQLPSGAIAFEKRPDTGLLGGLWALPCSEWEEAPIFQPPIDASWHDCGELRHIFTHIDLRLHVWRAEIKEAPKNKAYRFMNTNELALTDLPKLWAKALEVAG